MAAREKSHRRAARKRALLVGINQYPGASLKGCVNDALMMGNILIDNFGFLPGADMRLVVDDRATQKGILDRLAWLVEGARPGDVLVFHYSGHGAQVADRSGDEIDSLDECLCPIDFDWDHPLLDDHLGNVIDMVPEGANLTILLDCCHSGTGTRAIGTNVPMSMKRMTPPPDIQFRTVRDIEVDTSLDDRSVNMRSFRPVEIRRLGASAEQNGILIAGCRSDQLSKDALIDGDYHGALSYSLYQAIEQCGPGLSYCDWVKVATDLLKGYRIREQDPQLECRAEMSQWKLFSTDPASQPASYSARSVAKKCVVYVHGICEHESGFSDVWWSALAPYLDNLPNVHHQEVVWSDIVTPTDRSLEINEPVTADLAAIIRDTLQDRCQNQMLEATLASGGGEATIATRAILGIPGLDCIDDFVKYLLIDSIREQVIDRFNKVVKPLLEEGTEVEVISHSWGTVVAYEALRLMDEQEGLPKHSVLNLFTLGSPLSMGPVKRQLIPQAKDGHCPRIVKSWINLDARFDPVGGPMKGLPFQVDHEYLGLKPVGCSSILPSPACSHSSYFNPDNRAVNRDIFAAHINRSG
jgi:hypothetical protein